MKFVEPKPFTDPDAALRKLLEIANGVEVADRDGRLSIELVNGPFLAASATPAEYGEALRAAVERGYLTVHPSGAYLTFTQAGADLFS